MMSLKNRVALVIGGSSGVGKATVKNLIAEGAHVVAVARGADKLKALTNELGDRLTIIQGDATDSAFVERLLREQNPDLIVLATGTAPRLARVDEFDWETFSEAWNADVKASFLLVKQALTLPLRPGATVVLVSSGAAVDGSPLSGGYAGAKRMQWFLANYAQKASDAKKLGIRILAVLPRPIAGTSIGAGAAEVYGKINGITAEAFMKRIGVSLDQVASAILTSLGGSVPSDTNAIMISQTGIEPLK
jgi:NAD(P)-dependent dehydrogenase (short-subunit alcohol dehydrogenase family)